MRYYLTPVRMAIIKKTRSMLAKMWRKGNLCALLVRMYTSAAITENCMEAPQKIKNRNTIQSNNSTIGYLNPSKNEYTNSKSYRHPYVYCSIIYNSQDMEATCV